MLLRRYLQEKCGLSRRKLFAWMQEWDILLNDTVVSDFSVEVVDGDSIVIAGDSRRNYTVLLSEETKHLIAFHKPVGYVVSTTDPHNQTIYQLLPKEFSYYRYIGRLDKDSRGLLLLSDDLDLVHILSHPSHASEKVYIVIVDKKMSPQDVSACLKGVQDGEDILRAVSVDVLSGMTVRITLQEWKNRHIRRMLGVLWYDVLDLCRVSQGEYMLGDLEEGEYKVIDDIWF
jgi:23S rRNA pseudouridine2605 synthase